MTRPLISTEGMQVLDPEQLTRTQRLERWAMALERLGDAPLRTLREVEHEHYYERQQMREDHSPLTVAFDEPVLRSAGLKDDTFGEAARFFSLTDWQLHNVLCYCHFGSTVSAREVATRVRSIQHEANVSAKVMAQRYALGVGAITCGIGLALLLAV